MKERFFFSIDEVISLGEKELVRKTPQQRICEYLNQLSNIRSRFGIITGASITVAVAIVAYLVSPIEDQLNNNVEIDYLKKPKPAAFSEILFFQYTQTQTMPSGK